MGYMLQFGEIAHKSIKEYIIIIIIGQKDIIYYYYYYYYYYYTCIFVFLARATGSKTSSYLIWY